MPAPRDAAVWLGLAGWIGLSFLAAVPGSFFVATASEYQTLAQPGWAPPSWVFGPVWTTLYALMGIAAWLVWKEGGFGGAPVALGLFLAQLALNAVWTPLFFGAGRRGWAFLDIVLLAVVLAATIRAFWRIRPLAGALLLPYLGWVLFASVLNLAVWRMNA